MVKDSLNSRFTHPDPDTLLVARNYQTIYWALYRARRRAALDGSIQPCHGFRKYFENAPDQANIDHERKIMIEGNLGRDASKILYGARHGSAQRNISEGGPLH